MRQATVRVLILGLAVFFSACGESQTTQTAVPSEPDSSTGVDGSVQGVDGSITGAGPCDGQDEGAVLSQGEFGDCAFDSVCARTGTKSRVDTVCVEGEPTETSTIEACARETDGLVITEGVFGACEFGDDCVEQGSRTRLDLVCRDGAPVDTMTEEVCARVTEGVVLSEGVFGACEYADECVESGRQSRTDRVCLGGVAAEVGVTGECARVTEGVVLSEGAFGACEYADECVESGRQSRTDRVCLGGVAAEVGVTGECARVTEGVVLSEGAFGACEYADECVESGRQSRTDRVCLGGVAAEVGVTGECARVTEGVVLSEGAFGACEYADECVESGRQSRTDRVCVGGVAAEVGVTGECARVTEGVVLSEGVFGACEYADECVESGRQSRTDRVCLGGVAAEVGVTGECARVTEGVVLSEGVFGACEYADECVESGRQSRTDRVCLGGVAAEVGVTGECARVTEGVVLSEGVFGACEYADECVESGRQSRTDRVCLGGVAAEVGVTGECARVTEGVVLSEGVFGACEYADECVESGRQSRTDRVCLGGVAAEVGVTGECARVTEGMVLSEGVFGACEYADECVMLGHKRRTDTVCRAGVATNVDVPGDCGRETDGLVVREGQFDECTYASPCAESGDRARTDWVCVDGVAIEVEVPDECLRDTDGAVVTPGVFGGCDYQDQCAISGQKVKTDEVCEDGAAVLREVISQDGCERDAEPGWQVCAAEGCVDVNLSLLHCGACGVACPAHSECRDGQCDCLGNRAGPNCDCPPNFVGDQCDQCAGNFEGPECDRCQPGFGGPLCQQVAPLNYANYQRRAGVAFTPTPEALPVPTNACAAKPNQVSLDGTQLATDCVIAEDTCVRIVNGAEVVCEGGMTVDGVVWMTSTDTGANTLLIADYIEVGETGALYVTGDSPEQPYAQRAEIFLRHEYCGKPEDGFDADFAAASARDCRRKGKLVSAAGTVKIAGQPKTTWSLLTQDTRDSHADEPRAVAVDHCAGWRAGDLVSIAATGGEQETYQGVHNWCVGEDCSPKQNSKSEQRTIQRIDERDDGSCVVVLDEPLDMNHRGNSLGIASPMLRIQAEVVNHSRSVTITGGYQGDVNEPNSRVATRYDYSNDGTPSHTYGANPDVAPCRVCKFPDDPSAGPHELCTEAGACQVYDAEGEDIQLCGQDCSPIGMQGITTVQMMGGVMQVSHAAVEKCGRRELAEYCLHLHHVGDVKDAVSSGIASHESYFIGNAVSEGINKGITIHGTHNALVQSNVVHNQKGPGIYIEDGNELGNVVEENVVMCSEVQSNNVLCKFKNARNRPETTDSDWNEVSGIYFLAAMNHTIGNRVFGYDNAMYVNRNTSGQTGLGMARGKICTSSFPFGYTVGNVFHNNAGFGWYANTAFPMDLINLGGLELSSDGDQMKGTVVDWTKCLPFSLTGEDHSFNIKIQKHVEYFNDFSAGVYSVGDVTLEDYTTYGGNKGLYWKTYRRGANSDPLCVDCTFVRTTIEGPGGSALVEFANSDFYRSHEAYQVNHHCSLDGGTGGLCASHYDFRSSRFFEWSHQAQSYVPGGPFFYSGVYPTTTLIFTPDDKVLTHVTQNVGFNIDDEPRCESATPYAGDGWYGCDNAGGDAQAEPLELRIVRIYSPDRGMLTVTNHTEGGTTYAVPWTNHGPQSGGASAYGVLPNCQGADCPNYMRVSGYVFSIPASSEISLSFETLLAEDDVLADLFALEYSDEQMLPRTQLTINSVEGTVLMDSQVPCTIQSDHGRAFITPFGPVHGAAGAWYNECGHSWPLNHTMQALIDASYQGDGAQHGGGQHGGGDNGGNNCAADDQCDENQVCGEAGSCVVDLTAEPSTPSPWSERVHPEPDRVVSLYTSIDGHSDAFSNDDSCRRASACSWPQWGNQEGVCQRCDITWFPGWSPQRSYTFEHQLGADSGQTPADRILRVEMEPNWFSLFEFPPGDTLDLSGYDVLHFEVWTPGVTNLAVRARDYGENRVWDAALDDVERTKAVAFDDNLIPGQWSVIEINLDELFAPDAPRNLGQMLIVDVGPNVAGMPFYFSNIHFYRR